MKNTLALNVKITNESLCLVENITPGIDWPVGLTGVLQKAGRATINLDFQQSNLFTWRVNVDSCSMTKTDSLGYTVNVIFNGGRRSFKRWITLPNTKDSLEITLQVGNHKELPDEITAFFESTPGIEKRIEAAISNMVDSGRIDFRVLMEIFKIRFFPVSYYKPFKNCPEWKKSYTDWIESNERSDNERERMLSDKKSPAALSYLFQQISKEIKSRLKESDDLTLIFMGTSDSVAMKKRGIALLEDFECEGQRANRIDNNKQLACARGYFTMVEFMRYFAGDKRIKHDHIHFGADGKHPDNSIRAIILLNWQQPGNTEMQTKKLE